MTAVQLAPVTSGADTQAPVGATAGWLRAAVLGANDGLVSTASLLVGVAAADASRSAVVVAGVAGLVAGALSMGVGEFVSVSSQRDLERTQLDLEAVELVERPGAELEELTQLYESRGLNRALASDVAAALMEQHALETHAREELGIDVRAMARPTQAAVVSATSFTAGSLVPLLVATLASAALRIPLTIAFSSVGLVLLGVAGARVGGARAHRAAARVLAGGLLALAVSLGVGLLLGQAV